MALNHSSYGLKEKALLAILSSGERFIKDSKFKALSPEYDISSIDIQKYLAQEVEIKSFGDVIANIDQEISKSVSLYKTKNGETMIRASIKNEVFTQKLANEDAVSVIKNQSKIKTLAINIFHDKALTCFREKKVAAEATKDLSKGIKGILTKKNTKTQG